MKSIPYSLFNVYERYFLLQLVESIVEKKLEAIPELKSIYQQIKAIRSEMEVSLHKSRSSEYTAKIHEQDDIQDHGFLSFRMIVEAKAHSIIDLSLRQDSMEIQQIIRRHSWSLAKLGNKKQVTISKSLIKELSSADHQQTITKLNAIDEFNAWKEAVIAMDALFVDKAETESAQESTQGANELGKKVVKLFEKVLPGWAYQSEYGSNAAYGEMMEAIMEGVNELESQARTRTSKRKNSKEEDQN